MKLKQKLYSKLFGESIMEAMFLDMLLNALSDGYPRPSEALLTPTGDISAFDLKRQVDKLVEDRLIILEGTHFLITSNGKLHLSNGGYQEQVKQNRRSKVSFWFSIIAFIVSLISFFSSIFNR